MTSRKWKLTTATGMILVAYLALWMGLPFEWLTPQGQVFRRRADGLGKLAAEARASESRAMAEGDHARARQSRLRAEDLEGQAWTYRKAAFQHWKWPELKPPRRNPRGA